MPGATQYLEEQREFRFANGERLPWIKLAYETWGELDDARSNAVLILTGLSPSAHAASSEDDPEPGWWEPMVGPGKPIDTRRHFVICVNSLGSCWGSLGPASYNPDTGRPYRLDFPALAIEDIAAGAHRVVRHLGIERLAAVIGPSMGGMSAQAYLLQNPAGARHAVLISTAARAEPFSIAIRSLQREAIQADRRFKEGRYTDEEWPEAGMRLARKLGMISYRSAAEWRERFGREPQDHFPPQDFGMRFAVESYLEAAARRFVHSFDPCCYLYLSRSMDLFDAFGGKDTLAGAFAGLRLDSAHVIGVETDILFPLHQQRELADALEANGIRTRFDALPSLQGHDAFLVDYGRFNPAVARCFEAMSETC